MIDTAIDLSRLGSLQVICGFHCTSRSSFDKVYLMPAERKLDRRSDNGISVALLTTFQLDMGVSLGSKVTELPINWNYIY